MAKRKVKGMVAGKIRKGAKQHKGDETDYGFIELPGGIRNGIAKLTACKFDFYKSGINEGELYFLAAGTVVEPAESDSGIPVRGLRTQIMEPVCDTENRNGQETSTEDHLAKVFNELRKLGLDTAELDEDSMDDDDWKDVLSSLVEEGVYFRFSTSQSEPTDEFPNPRVWQNWYGSKGLEDYEAQGSEVEDDVVDESGDEDEEEAEEESPAEVTELAALADEGDEEAQTKLEGLCDEAGIDPEDYATWVEVVEVLEGGDDSEEEESEEEAEEEEAEEEEDSEDEYEEIEPEKGEIYFFKPPRAKVKVECEVTAVVKSKKTASLKAEESGKVYKEVAWGKLSYDPD